MAENEFNSLTSFYQATYGNSTLHTNYHYFRFNSFLKDAKSAMAELNRISGNMATLEAKENEFYKKFGKNNYEEFMEFLRELMKSEDAVLLKKASNANVSKLIDRIISGKTNNQDLNDLDLIITVNSSLAQKEANQVSKILSSTFGQSVDLGLSIKGNVQNMKKLANKLAGKHFHVSSFNTEALSSFLKADTKIDDLISISMGGEVVTSQEISKLIKYRPYPWGYTLTEIQHGLDTNTKQTIAELQQAIKDIRIEIKNYFGEGSKDFNQALELTLNSVLSSDYYIFFIGSNVRNGLLGAFGEFGTALLTNYLYIKTNTQIEQSIARVVGQNLGKQDVLVFDAFGIQVKNYAVVDNFTRKNIEVRQHPSELGQYFNETSSFTGFLANVFFNADINKHYFSAIYDLEEILKKEYSAELLRTAVADISDTVCFYNISQQYFLPGSRIIKFYQDCIDSLETKIESNSSIHWSDGPSRGPNEYWEWTGYSWKPTEKNANLFSYLINKGITIKTTMKGLSLGLYSY